MHSPGAVIKRTREFRGIGQKEFAEKIGVSVSKLYRLEHNDPRVDRDSYVRAARELGIVVDWTRRLAELPKDVPPDDFTETAWAPDGNTERHKERAFSMIQRLAENGLLNDGDWQRLLQIHRAAARPRRGDPK